MNYFSINGYWKDDKSRFEGYIVREFDDSPNEDDIFTDDDIFFYGLSEKDIKEAIEQGESYGENFIITSYEKI